MVILTNDEGKEIQITYDKDIITHYDRNTGKTLYAVSMPIITCDDPLDAEYLRVSIHKAVNNLVRGILE